MIDRREADAGADGGLGGRGEGVSSRDGGCNLGLQPAIGTIYQLQHSSA